MTATPDAPRDDLPTGTATIVAEIEASVGDPDDPGRIWLDGEDHPEPGDEQIEAVDSRLAAGIATGRLAQQREHVESNEDAVRVFHRGDRTILLCLDGHGGGLAAEAAADLLDHELGESDASLDDAAYLVDVLLGVNDAVRNECARSGHPGSRASVALAVVEDGLVRWASLGDSLIALVHPDGTAQRLGTPRQRFLGTPMIRTELAASLVTGTARLWCGGWLVLTTRVDTDGKPDWRDTLLDAAVVRGHYPVDDVRRALDIPAAATVVRDLLDAGDVEGAVAVVVLGRPAFVDLSIEDRAKELAAWEDPAYPVGRRFPMGPGHGHSPDGRPRWRPGAGC